MKTIEERLGLKIASQRKAVGLTQVELAEAVGVQSQAICRIEAGRRKASLGLIAQLAEALDVKMHELFHFPNEGDPRDRAIQRLLQFASRRAPEEIDLLVDLGGAILEWAKKREGAR